MDFSFKLHSYFKLIKLKIINDCKLSKQFAEQSPQSSPSSWRSQGKGSPQSFHHPAAGKDFGDITPLFLYYTAGDRYSWYDKGTHFLQCPMNLEALLCRFCQLEINLLWPYWLTRLNPCHFSSWQDLRSPSLTYVLPKIEEFLPSFDRLKFCAFQMVSKKSSDKGDIRERWEPEHRDEITSARSHKQKR